MTGLPVLNLDEVTFECVYGRGCDGICCQNGRPPVAADEQERIDANLDRFLPHLTEKARKTIEKGGYLSRRLKSGKPMLRVIDGWCVFFNAGCVLHKVGMQEGDKFRYKPAPCSLFPLEHDDDGRWYVRQHGYKGEQWDLFCLAPDFSTVPAAQSLEEELAFARRRVAGVAGEKRGRAKKSRCDSSRRRPSP
ncbi:MAG: DUF3109 family protein [Gemmataceae bacterium]